MRLRNWETAESVDLASDSIMNYNSITCYRQLSKYTYSTVGKLAIVCLVRGRFSRQVRRSRDQANKADLESAPREDESSRNSITYTFVRLARRVAAFSLYPIIYGAQCRLIMAGPICRWFGRVKPTRVIQILSQSSHTYVCPFSPGGRLYSAHYKNEQRESNARSRIRWTPTRWVDELSLKKVLPALRTR